MIAALLLALAMDVAAPRWRAPQSLFEPAPLRESWSAPRAWHGRLLTTDAVHIGARVHALVAPGELGAALTVQVSTTALP